MVKEVTIFHSGETIQIKEDMCCTTTEVLYVLSCTKPGCGKQYGGETGRAVYLRYVEHEDDARDPNTTKPIGLHFQLPGHSVKDMEMIPVEKVRGGIAVRKIRELALIRKYKLASHLGLNTQA